MAVEEANPAPKLGSPAAPTWAQRAEALTHILTHPSHSPSLHSQLFVASRVPCPPSGPGSTTSYPPFLCPGASLLRWALASVFLPRAARLGLPPSSWRSRCPFQLPPPLVPSAGIEPAPERLGDAELTAYARRRRARRGPLTVRPPMSVAGAVLTTVPSVVIVVAFIKEFLWIRPPTAPEDAGSGFRKHRDLGSSIKHLDLFMHAWGTREPRVQTVLGPSWQKKPPRGPPPANQSGQISSSLRASLQHFSCEKQVPEGSASNLLGDADVLDSNQVDNMCCTPPACTRDSFAHLGQTEFWRSSRRSHVEQFGFRSVHFRLRGLVCGMMFLFSPVFHLDHLEIGMMFSDKTEIVLYLH